MKYKKSSRDSTDIFGTFLSDVSSSESSVDQNIQSGLTPPDLNQETTTTNTESTSSVAILMYLLTNGPQLAGPILSGTGLPIQDFFIAAESLKRTGLVESSMSDAGETLSLTEAGRGRAEHWKSTLSFMMKD